MNKYTVILTYTQQRTFTSLAKDYDEALSWAMHQESKEPTWAGMPPLVVPSEGVTAHLVRVEMVLEEEGIHG